MAKEARLRRVSDQIQRELSEIIRTELKDPRVGMITLTGVDVSVDLAHAKVYFTLLGGADTLALAEHGLARAGGFLRSSLARRINTHKVPELHFHHDASVEQGIRLTQLIDEAVSGTRK